MHAYMQKRSSLRRMVDEKLAAQGLTLSEFIGDRRNAGDTVDEALTTLQDLTGVPVALRTLWSWLKTDEYAAANPAKETA